MNIERDPWRDCADVPFGTITRIGRLPRGTLNGKSSITVLIETKDGKKMMGETTLALLMGAAAALRGAADAAGEDARG